MLKRTRTGQIYAQRVTPDAKQNNSQQRAGPMQFQRFSVMNGDRTEPGNADWTPVKIALPPEGT